MFLTKIDTPYYRGASRHQKLPLDGAKDLLSKSLHHIPTVIFVSTFIFVSPRKPENASQHV